MKALRVVFLFLSLHPSAFAGVCMGAMESNLSRYRALSGDALRQVDDWILRYRSVVETAVDQILGMRRDPRDLHEINRGEVVELTLLKAALHFDADRLGPFDVEGYIKSIAANVIRDQLEAVFRQRRSAGISFSAMQERLPEGMDYDVADRKTPEPSQEADRNLLSAQLAEALALLPEYQRLKVTDHYLRDIHGANDYRNVAIQKGLANLRQIMSMNSRERWSGQNVVFWMSLEFGVEALGPVRVALELMDSWEQRRERYLAWKSDRSRKGIDSWWTQEVFDQLARIESRFPDHSDRLQKALKIRPIPWSECLVIAQLIRSAVDRRQ